MSTTASDDADVMWDSDSEGSERGGVQVPVVDAREVYSRWVDRHHDDLLGAFDALRSWLHATISPIMFRMDFGEFCRFAYASSRP
jgi:hypothetical protein